MMRLGKILMVLCIAVAVSSVFVLGATGLACAKSAPDITDVQGGQANVESQLPKGTDKSKDKGSPMHAWKAIVDAGKKAGDTITSAEFAGMRNNWSASTRGYELRSLVAIGVLMPTDTKGEYELLVGATPAQIDQINNEAKGVVNKTSRDGKKTALGIDYYVLDASHLGEGDTASGDAKLQRISNIIGKVTGIPLVADESIDKNLVQEDIAAGIVPASVAINGDISFTVNDINLETIQGVDNAEEAQALLAALVDTRIASPEAIIKEGTADFSAVQAKTVMFKDDFVADKTDAFKTEFAKLDVNDTAVIIAINRDEQAIEAALKTAGLLGELGNRIIIMGVQPPDSPSAVAFGRLFGDSGIIDLRGQTIEKILESRGLVVGLKGAV